MSIMDIPLFSMLKTRMLWHQERQRLLAENISNADTPNFQPRDLAQPKFDGSRAINSSLELARTSPAHLTSSAATTKFQLDRRGNFEVRPAGNAVGLEEEMLKVASNQMDYQAATTLYSRGLGLLRTAIGKHT
jgi:flagellar basal-body rod protein FlgB